MLNLELIDRLYASLPKEKQQELTTLLFKKSKQTMSYFHRTKDISLSKLEILSDFFGLPLDAFIKDSKFKMTYVTGNNNYVGNVAISTNLMMENQSLRKEIESQQAIINAKDETIGTLKHMNQMLQAQADNNIKKAE